MGRLARALEDAVRERQVLLHVALDLEQVSEVEAVAAAHGVPAHRALEGLDGGLVVIGPHAGQREVGVETVERLAHVVQGAGVLLHPAVCEALEDRGEAEPLLVLGGHAVPVDVLLDVLGEPRENVTRRLVLALDDHALGALDLIGHAGATHVPPIAASAALVFTWFIIPHAARVIRLAAPRAGETRFDHAARRRPRPPPRLSARGAT